MVATPHGLASTTALDILRRGGSAVDAAIAANAVLCVAYPHMAGLGGDGFWLVSGTDGDIRGINASGPAGKRATREYYTDRGYDEIPDRGPESALTVPGAVDGWRIAHAEYGQLEWEALFKDAITCARDGVPVTEDFSRWISADRSILATNERAAETFLVDGTAPDPGTCLPQPNLAKTFGTLARDGPRDGFYEGAIAERFCGALGDDSPLEPSDLAHYSAEWVSPLSIPYRDYTVHTLPPNTQGLGALQLLGFLDGFDPTDWGDGSAAYYHHMTEATKLAFADRDAWVTDPEFVDIPTEALLSTSYLDERRARISATETLSATPDSGLAPTQHDSTTLDAGGDTCYLSIVDENGLAVSLIQSIYFDFGSGLVAGDTGIVPQNRGSFFSLDRTHVNRLEPGKRSFHTLIPSMLTRDGEPRLVYGTMGGEGQPQTQAALVSRIVDFEYDVQRAIEAPRWLFGRTWGEQSRSLTVEGRVPDRVVTELERRGHRISLARNWDDTMGHAQAIRIHPDGTLEGGADPRGDGVAIGY